MPNGTYGGVRGRETKVGRKLSFSSYSIFPCLRDVLGSIFLSLAFKTIGLSAFRAVAPFAKAENATNIAVKRMKEFVDAERGTEISFRKLFDFIIWLNKSFHLYLQSQGFWVTYLERWVSG